MDHYYLSASLLPSRAIKKSELDHVPSIGKKKTSLPTHVQNILLPIAPLTYFLTSYSILTLPGIILYTYKGISCGLVARDLWCLHKLIHHAGENTVGFFCNL